MATANLSSTSYPETMDRFDRITIEPDKCGGNPCIRGMRITVRRVVELLDIHPDRAELIREYPFLEDEDLTQATEYEQATRNSVS